MSVWGELGSPTWWIDLAERTIRTWCQTTGGALLVGSALGPVTSLPWTTAVEIGCSAAALCVLTGLGSIAVPGSDQQTASFLPAPKR